MTDQTFTVAGTSKHNGGFKVRFANDMMRIKNLTKSGHTDIVLVELPKAMTKLDWKPKYDLPMLVKDMVESDVELFKKEKLLKDSGFIVNDAHE